MKKTCCIMLALMVMTTATACSSSGTAKGESTASAQAAAEQGTEAPASAQKGEYTLKIGSSVAENDPVTRGLWKFEEIVEEKTGGAVQVEIYPASQLGADEDLIEQATMGTGIGLITDAGRLGTYVNDYGILGAPYLVDNYEEALKLLETSSYDDMLEQLSEKGLRVLSGNWYAGTRQLFMKQEVKTPGDLKGLRVRSSGSAIVSGTIEAMGADPTVLPWSEAYSGLQQKVIDGLEAHYSAAVGSSIFEVSTYLCKTGHFQHILNVVISEKWYQNLPEEYQQILVDASYEGGIAASEETLEKDEEYEKTLTDNGMTIVEVDIDAFKAATDHVYDDLNLRELKNQIDKELGK